MSVDPGKKIKVLFVVKWYPDKADPQLGVFIKKHAQAVALFTDVAVIYISPFNSEYQNTDFYVSEEKNVKQFFHYYRKGPLKIINLINYYLLVRKSWNVVVKDFGKPDIIHAHVIGRPWLLAYYFSKINHIPFLITEHWTGFVNNKFKTKPSWYIWIVKFMASRASGFTVVSENLKRAITRAGFKNKIEVIANVVDLPGNKNTNSPDHIMILVVADLLDEQKNISAVIKAVARVSKTNRHLELHIIGGGPDEGKLKDLARTNGTLDLIVYFHGRKNNDEVYDFLHRASFVIVNSNYETFSVVTAESLACGKPVIATISGGPEEIITEQTGVLIEKGDDVALEKSINYMLENYGNFDPEVLRSSVVEKFSRERTGAAFLKLYNEILSSK